MKITRSSDYFGRSIEMVRLISNHWSIISEQKRKVKTDDSRFYKKIVDFTPEIPRLYLEKDSAFWVNMEVSLL
ncbi:MAG: hypothetical protein MI921_12920 [Cytophagales bacterium]|nr:hypothetical protein [Cytophagales bacterium]